MCKNSFRYTWNFPKIWPYEYLFDDWLARIEKKFMQSLTTVADPVWNSFIRERVTVNSRERVIFRHKFSKPFSKFTTIFDTSASQLKQIVRVISKRFVPSDAPRPERPRQRQAVGSQKHRGPDGKDWNQRSRCLWSEAIAIAADGGWSQLYLLLPQSIQLCGSRVGT